MRTRQFHASDLFVTAGGRHSVSPTYHITYRHRRDFALVYVLAGEGVIRYGRKEHRIGANTIFALIADTNVSYWTNPENLWKFLWIGFRGEQARTLLDQSGLTSTHPVLTGDAIFQMRSHFIELQQIGSSGKPGVFCSVLGKLRIILGELINQHSAKRRQGISDSQSSFDLTARVSKYLTEHLAQTITLQQLSRQFFISPYLLVRTFRKELGQSPIDHLIDERIRAAQHLLLDESKSIAEVAQCISYQDAAYFSRLFKKRTGFSPIQFRKRHG